jgi:hypothetical protein
MENHPVIRPGSNHVENITLAGRRVVIHERWYHASHWRVG